MQVHCRGKGCVWGCWVSWDRVRRVARARGDSLAIMHIQVDILANHPGHGCVQESWNAGKEGKVSRGRNGATGQEVTGMDAQEVPPEHQEELLFLPPHWRFSRTICMQSCMFRHFRSRINVIYYLVSKASLNVSSVSYQQGFNNKSFLLMCHFTFNGISCTSLAYLIECFRFVC